MRLMTLTDGSESLLVDDRPADDDLFDSPLPYGLTLDDAVAVRAREVEAGDLVVALTAGEPGARQVDHCPLPFPAVPQSISACPCTGCEECAELEEWTMADHARVADVGWRYVCLSPSERDESCVIERSNRPVVVVRAARVQRARAASEAVRRMFTVTWSMDVEAATAEEAQRLASAQARRELEDPSATRWAVSVCAEEVGE